ncbi:MAG: murein hydrolase activator EnvC family protein [Bacteroidales bacterium]
MNKRTGYRSFVSAIFLICVLFQQAGAQTREELEQNKEVLEKEIRMTNQLLEETRQTTETNVNELVMLNNQMERRRELLSTIQDEIRYIDRRIDSLSVSVTRLEDELEELKESYAQMVRHAARNRDAYQRLMFIFSSSNFNQAYLRMRYLQQYARHRRQQAEKIQETRETIAMQITEMEEERERQQTLLARQREEVSELAREQARQEKTVSQLKQEEDTLRQQLREQQQQAQELENSIRRIIAEERRQAQDKAEAEGRETTDMFALTPEEQLLSDNFASNKGRLPWPLERGVITSSFGEQSHPVLPGIRISNNGIDISTSEGANARTIFDGTVSRVISVPGGVYAVIIRHGEYLSVYSNLSEVFVTKGQEVSAREELGVVGTNQQEARTALHLEIWKGNEKQNPTTWIARQQ